MDAEIDRNDSHEFIITNQNVFVHFSVPPHTQLCEKPQLLRGSLALRIIVIKICLLLNAPR